MPVRWSRRIGLSADQQIVGKIGFFADSRPASAVAAAVGPAYFADSADSVGPALNYPVSAGPVSVDPVFVGPAAVASDPDLIGRFSGYPGSSVGFVAVAVVASVPPVFSSRIHD